MFDELLRPVIIIGAPRSGTNILRNVLTRLPGTCTWPCDEINYIWRHGNASQKTDEFPPELARSDVKDFIHKAFRKLAFRYEVPTIIEKTCANSLRVDFVDSIFSTAKYIYIIRDGRDAAASAMIRWRASLDLPYILRKARYVPVTDIPYYGGRYFWNRLHRLTSGEHRLAAWGPRFQGLEEVLHKYSLAGACAVQWSRCVEKADVSFSQLDENRVFTLSYEDFVTQPVNEIVRLASFIGIDSDADIVQKASVDVSSANIGKWKKSLPSADLDLIEDLAGATLTKHDYR